MNETMTGMKQATVKGDIFALLFKGKNDSSKDESGNTDGMQTSFQSVLQESLKTNKTKGVKNSLQAIIKKKAEIAGSSKTALQAKIAAQKGTPSKQPSDFDGLSTLECADIAESADEMTAVGKRQAVLPFPGMAEAAGSGEPSGRDVRHRRLPDMMFGPKVMPNREQNVSMTEDAVQEEDAKRLLIAKTMPGLEKKRDSQITAPIFPEKAWNQEATAQQNILNTPTPKGMSNEAAMEMKGDLARIIAKEASNTDAGTVESAAAQISFLVVDFVRTVSQEAVPRNTEAAMAKKMETEIFFKEKVSEVLVEKGFREETAKRIAEQIRTATVVREVALPDMRALAKPNVDIQPKTGDGPLLKNSLQEKPVDLLNTAGAVEKSAVPVVAKEHAGGSGFVVATTPRKDIKDETPLAAGFGREENALGKIPAETLADGKSIQGDIFRAEASRSKQGNQEIGRINTHEPLAGANPTALYQAASTKERSSLITPVKAQDIIEQISDLRNARTDPSGRVKVVLDPPHLGTVEMDIIVRGNRVSAVMTAESSEVRQILQSHADDMRQALSDQGFRIDRIEVKQSDEKSSQQWSNNGREWNQQQDGGGYRQHRERNRQQKFNMSDYIAQFNVVA